MRLTSSYVYIFLLLLPVLFTGGHAFAQREMQDSLSLLLRAHLVRDTQRVVLLNQLSRVYFNRQPAQAFVYAKEALHISDSLHYTKGKIWAKRNMALVENVHGNLEKQMELTVTALALAEPNDLPAMAVLYNDIGNIYVEQEHPEQGLAYFKKSLPIKQYLHQQVEVGKTLNNIGCAYLKLQQLDSALHYLQAAEAIKLSFQDRPSLAFTYENIGIIHMLSGDYPKSLHYHELSAAYYKEANNLLGLTKAYLNLGLINTMLKRYPVADKYLSNAASLNETQQNVRNELIYYRYRAQLDSARHDYLSALNNYKHYASLNESFFNKEKTQLIEQTREKYESEKRQRENEILKRSSG
ncbi:tetratricopeptide repeat protein [Chitinophaga pendula]|uniref:tetratricopeptide repeat protein n=1 Tax=Chitinophaga pendula TaxID=2849666 RepID=UPI001CECBAEE|nr:tetratricopeptide repeat protein [Chitinophaga pendula]UCJ09414.1 tetratricopeptide repeat protein [Chitinophaga pendula]